MLISKLVGERTKTAPSDAVIKSHSLMIRAGYIKLVSNGIWSLAMPAKRIAKKIENIIREEMDALEGQECTFPVVMPRELWEESGRYTSIGDEMVRFKDRFGRDMVLGMTHEEAAVQFARDAVNSYQQLPFMIYQIQTKFRDEGRPRGGLIRVREFTMKDAYSFHMTKEDLETYYERAYHAYERIFKRIGMKNFIAVKSDSGMMGGSISHEFMLLTPIGEDTIVICPKCGLSANMEVATSILNDAEKEEALPMEEVFTGAAKEIREVTEYLGDIPAEKTIKAVCYNIRGDSERTVVAFIRGDLEVNEAKLKKVIKADIVPANLNSDELVAGNIGPVGLSGKNIVIVYDNSVKGTVNMVSGANKAEYHLKNVTEGRDFSVSESYDIRKVKAGEKCPVCGGELTVQNGIEIGNIFQLGTKYTTAMGMTVLNAEGKAVNPIMGCYGIGIGRAMASVAEETADEKGLNWPMAIAPWHVYLCVIRPDDEKVKEKAYALYDEMQKRGIEVLMDDRAASAGFKFADCDLMGIPLRLVVSPRAIENDAAEIKIRATGETITCPYEECIDRIKEMIDAAI
ncbi:MAG TPA: proline--tRNA ligase [Candidatus Stercoripulliclostridium merdigallinarum]|uniref:Proline--tRNA ligase n=1 Tax=Candidatus Stercoripulliclostridium merdigallinarum TaxID=2840951 RepID=A0A9D1SIE3_9FIRM|nr:proline--tRNA ligase [Candidatus Stercoripulliclostridium merdigallinarum]